MQMQWMQHICYSANLCANVIDNLKRTYSLYLKIIFVMPWLKSEITSSVVKYRRVSQRISFKRRCLKHLHMNLHHSKCVAFTAFAFWHRVRMWVQIWFFILWLFLHQWFYVNMAMGTQYSVWIVGPLSNATWLTMFMQFTGCQRAASSAFLLARKCIDWLWEC